VEYHFTIISSLAIVSFLVVFYVFLDHLISGEKTEVNTIFSLLLLAILAWNFAAIFEISAASDTALLFWKKLSYIGITLLGVFWLVLALNLTTGADHVRLFRLPFFVLVGPNLIALVALMTNEQHHLFFREVGLKKLVFGPFFYVAAFFFFLYMIVGIFLYVYHILQHKEWYYRKQSLYMTFGAVLPLTIHLLYILRVLRFPFDITPITFSFSALAFMLTISRYGLFNIVPIAHRYMVNSMSDGMIVLDRGGAIIEINQAARGILGVDGTNLIGKSCVEIMSSRIGDKMRRVLSTIEKAPSSLMEVTSLMHAFSDITIDVTVSNIRGDNNHALGKLAVIRDVTDRVNSERKLQELSIRDDLTNLYNQRYFYRLLNREVRRADRQDHSLSLMVLDIDNFKEYNDKFGHVEGNKVLARVGELILENIRHGVDSAFRFGGDEFVAVLPEVDIEQATQVAERLRTTFESCKIGNLTLSLGIAEYQQQGDKETLFELADQAMYKAKRSGRNRLHVVMSNRGRDE
jgi:diguanylate cyclase (GGDEF)-like protein/PAS domain S-box-containing protein